VAAKNYQKRSFSDGSNHYQTRFQAESTGVSV
jgi:hypothetical protein